MLCCAKRFAIHAIDVLIEWEKFSQVTGDHCTLHCGIEANEQEEEKNTYTHTNGKTEHDRANEINKDG